MLEPEIRFAANVPRWTIVPMNRPGTLAEHQYFVALYTYRVASELKRTLRSSAVFDWRIDRMVMYALVHDFDEIITGDMPSPTKIALKKDRVAWAQFSNWLRMTMKKMLPWVVELQDDTALLPGEVALVKFCDFLEAGLKLKEDTVRGNKQVEPHFAYIEQSCKDFVDANFDADVADALFAIWDDSIRRMEVPDEIKVVGTF